MIFSNLETRPCDCGDIITILYQMFTNIRLRDEMLGMIHSVKLLPLGNLLVLILNLLDLKMSIKPCGFLKNVKSG